MGGLYGQVQFRVWGPWPCHFPSFLHNTNPREFREQQLLREGGGGLGRWARDSVIHSSRGGYAIFSLAPLNGPVCMTPFLGLFSPCPSDTFPISVHTGRCLSLSIFMQFLSLPPSFTPIALVPIHSPLSAAAEGPNWKGGAQATQPERAEKRGRERERAKETWICYSWDMHWEKVKKAERT